MESQSITSVSLDSPVEVRAGEELDLEALGSYLERELPELAGEIRVRQFPSGYSNLTYLIESGLIESGERELVLRRGPFGANIKSAHDMGREFSILSALAGTYPKVPQPVHYCEDSAILGAPFYLMNRVTGVVLRPRMAEEEAPDPTTMAGIASSLVETLAELHGVDYRAIGLGELGKPEGYVRRQVEGWTRRYEAARTDETPAVDQAAAWLATHLPEESGAALIHNDFKYDNLVLDPDDPTRVLAVLDWEMATLGDPMMDLGTSLGYWVDPDDPPQMHELRLSPTTLPGNPTRVEVAERYCRLTGREPDNLVFYYVYGLFKIAVIIQQIYARYRRGDTHDPRFASLIDGVRLCGLMASQAISRARIDRLFKSGL